MYIKFNSYNESLRDKMVSKELNPYAQKFINIVNEFESIIEIEPEYNETINNEYRCTFIIDNDDRDTKFIDIIFNVDTESWRSEIYHGLIKELEEIDDNNGNSLINKILNILFPDVEKNIEKMEKKLELNKRVLKRLNNIKNRSN